MKIKSTLLAIGIGAFAGAVHAQSSVTLYGLLDVGIEYKNHVPSGTKNQSQSSLVQMQSGNLLGNRWGLLGKEDLGGGLMAIFDIENGFSINNGQLAQGGREFGRKSYVGLSSSTWGTLTFGRQNDLVYEYLTNYDISQFSEYSAYDFDPFLVSRMDNSAKYVISRAGVTVGAMYSTGFDSTIPNGAQVAGASKVGREYQFVLNYQTSSPFAGAVAFDQQQGTSIATQSAALQRIVAGGSYAIGKATIYAGIRWLNGQNQASASSSNLYWAGLTYHVNPAFSVSASGYHEQLRDTHNGPSSGVIYLDYFLSKTTDFYALFSRVWNTATTNLGVDGSGFNTAVGVSQTGAIVGIKHTF